MNYRAVHGEMRMKPIALTIALTVLLAPTMATGGIRVAVDYDAAALTQIKIDSGRLHYVWHTLRHYGEGKLVMPPQDMTAYDRHEAHIWLTAEENQAVADWIENHDLLEMPKEYPTRQPATYGSAFKLTLEACLGDRAHSIRWTEDSRITAELRAAAVAELEDLCKTIRSSRLSEGG